MLTQVLEPILKNWRILALSCAALLVAGFLLYMLGRSHGHAACEAGYAAANLEATQDHAKANSDALAKEMKATTERVKAHTDRKRAIEENTDATADDIAPALDQLFYDRLRAGDGQAP